MTITRNGEPTTSLRDLGEFDVFVRDPQSVAILHKVLAKGEPSITSILSRDTPFGIPSNYSGFHEQARSGDVPLYLIRRMKRRVVFIPRKEINKNTDLISTYKVLLPKAYNGGDAIPHQIVGKPELATSPSVCTQSYIFLRLDSESAAQSAQSYYTTRFFRFLVSLRKITQDALHSTFKWVPIQEWDKIWSDELLYAKYGISRKEQAYIESQVKVMSIDGGDE
ncbi:MAG: hypothetical protein KJ558_15340 [Gammaproteobacteria bacterium]|nr:hypothetical protein [Gammaproteobacteria bacterium]MBU1656162.1 hypothetical protein [Gammaproteobacteria bacterium]MBU1961030.1 hypothetical protein [Gammaproteobacteria bacterium]